MIKVTNAAEACSPREHHLLQITEEDFPAVKTTIPLWSAETNATGTATFLCRESGAVWAS